MKVASSVSVAPVKSSILSEKQPAGASAGPSYLKKYALMII
ncbi:hypothetical protein LTSEWAN_3147 [Salmonella enterica subsp. enterica serovar Wandsworth str. A4-580]|uniref:Uncharacterized protein n=1 Tax=Salmonella enterica subsp. enterica serovar Wandsworth str. A4-580 TaxID=913086 RepID=G5SD03_SALET|nr:hypothetical protein LTSEWAN_3147 [Salmonella enterica subsp. enterica serovar Wandsworth str. A4-580]